MKKRLCDRDVTHTKSKGFWMPQRCIFVTLNGVFSIHHGLFFFCYTFSFIQNKQYFYKVYLINCIKQEWLDFWKWQIILQWMTFSSSPALSFWLFFYSPEINYRKSSPDLFIRRTACFRTSLWLEYDTLPTLLSWGNK